MSAMKTFCSTCQCGQPESRPIEGESTTQFVPVRITPAKIGRPRKDANAKYARLEAASEPTDPNDPEIYQYKIDTEKTLPRRYPPRKYPFPVMNVGDSFTVPPEHSEPLIVIANRIRSHAQQLQKSSGRKFLIRTINDENIVRCWRVK